VASGSTSGRTALPAISASRSGSLAASAGRPMRAASGALKCTMRGADSGSGMTFE
jgi:hypothetical protein